MPLWIKELLSGFVVGVANIIPGVSGGTLMLVLGLYERVMKAISGLKAGIVPQFFSHLSKFLFTKERRENLTAMVTIFKTIDGFFLLRLVLGAGLAIFLLSDLMKYLLTEQFSNTYAFFFGLILISTYFTAKLVKRKNLKLIFPLLVGIIATVALTLSVNPAESTQNKSEHYKKLYESSSATEQLTANVLKSGRLQYQGHYSPTDFAASAMSGAVSVSAMILPGLSGSLVLILIGQYYEILSAISGLRTLQIDYALFLVVFLLGVILGGLLFAKLINYVFKRYHDVTMSLLIGLMAGSLYTLWPFKKTVIIDQYVRSSQGITILNDTVVHTNINSLPPSFGAFLWTFLFCTAGILVMLYFTRLDKKTATVSHD